MMFIIIIATQRSTNTKLNKHNDSILRDLQAYKKANDIHLQELQLILLENPINAYAGLKARVDGRLEIPE